MKTQAATTPGWAAELPSIPKTNVETIPLYSVQLLGGQNFFTNQTPSLSADFSAMAAPAVKFNDNWSFLPTVETNYTGTRQVLDLIAGGTLIQSQWDNKISLKGIYTSDSGQWRLKPYANFMYEFLQQSVDEQIGQGLYDYYQWDVGADLEYVYQDPFSVSFGVDYFQTHFPNYTSLESQAATQVGGQSLARELVGNFVLDTQNIMASAGANYPFADGRVVLEGTLAGLDERFPNQRLVDAAGNLDNPLREDFLTILGAALRFPRQYSSTYKTLGSLAVGYTYDSSNQNSFDATETQFIPYFYNYGEFKLSPDYQMLIGPEKKPIMVDVGGTWWWRRYPHRLIQDPNGLYLQQDLYMNNWMVAATVSYPLAEHFKLLLNAQYGHGMSNDQFQVFYQYNYVTATYMAGFRYDY